MKSHFFFVFIVIMLISANVAAVGIVDTVKDTTNTVKEVSEVAKFVYDLLSTKLWAGDWKVANDEGNPVKNVKKSDGKRIHSWIDITGFRNESVINGTRYVNGSAKDHAIVKREAKCKLKSGERKISFNTTTSITNDCNTTTVVQKSILKYETWVCIIADDWMWITQDPEELTVSTTVKSPETFTTKIPNVTANILVYNRSVAPVTYIYVPNENHSSMKDVMIVNCTYNGSSVCRYDQVGEVLENSRGAEYVQFIDDGWYPLWIKDDNQTEIDHCGRMVTIFDPNFDMSLLNISLHTPYETKYIENFTMKAISGKVIIPMPFIKIILLLIGSVVGLIIIWRVAKRALF